MFTSSCSVGRAKYTGFQVWLGSGEGTPFAEVTGREWFELGRESKKEEARVALKVLQKYNNAGHLPGPRSRPDYS